jgi:glycosyltransferase involved in cell wall biosynthesis
MNCSNKVLFFAWRPRVNASARYRIYQYLPRMRDAGIDCRVCAPSSEALFIRWYGSGGKVGKAFYLMISLFNRCCQVFLLARGYRVVFVQRELFPVGPPLLEWILHKTGKKIIYDFDDAVFLRPPYITSGFMSWLHYYGKAEKIIRWSSTVIAGNGYLAAYARRYNGDVRIIPTVPGPQNQLPPRDCGDRLVVGWSGTAGNLVHLRSVSDALALLKERFANLEIQVISDGRFSDPRFETINREWRMDSEQELIRRFTVGIAPLLDVPYSRGKCGFKILSYMKAGVPVVCSSAGVHAEIIRDGENGYLCSDIGEWVEKTSRLLMDEDLRERFRTEGYRTLEKDYSFDRYSGEIEAAIVNLLWGCEG